MKSACLKAIAATLLGFALAPAHAVTISLTPATTIAMPGDMVSLDLVISGLGDGTAPSVGDFDLNIGFDAGALSFTGYTLGGGLGDLGLFEAFDFSLGSLGGGLVNLSEVSLLENDAGTCIFCIAPYLEDLQGDSVILATLDFTVDVLALGSSTSVVIDSVFALGDGFGQALQIDQTNNAVIRNPDLTAVPEPGTLLTFGLGLVLMLAARRRLAILR